MLSRRSVLSLFLCALGWGPGAAIAQTRVQEFALGGSAFLLNKECIRLTPDQPYRTGSAWFQEPIALSRPFDMRVSLVLGTKNREGADGIVFVFHPAMQTGFRGEGMGFAGLVPSIGIEFDTYQNTHLADPAFDHVALMTNGARHHVASPIPLGDLEDGARHPLRISWRPKGPGLEIQLDGQPVATYPADLVRRTFSGHATVYWGMTAGTGRLSNPQDVCIDRMLLGAL